MRTDGQTDGHDDADSRRFFSVLRRRLEMEPIFSLPFREPDKSSLCSRVLFMEG